MTTESKKTPPATGGSSLQRNKERMAGSFARDLYDVLWEAQRDGKRLGLSEQEYALTLDQLVAECGKRFNHSALAQWWESYCNDNPLYSYSADRSVKVRRKVHLLMRRYTGIYRNVGGKHWSSKTNPPRYVLGDSALKVWVKGRPAIRGHEADYDPTKKYDTAKTATAKMAWRDDTRAMLNKKKPTVAELRHQLERALDLFLEQ